MRPRFCFRFLLVPRFLVFLALVACVQAWPASAQDRLKHMPGYERYEKMRRESTNALKSGALSVSWKDNGKAVEFSREGKRYRYDVAARSLIELTNAARPAPSSAAEDTGGRRRAAHGEGNERPERGRQFTRATSPDGKLTALCRDRNVWLRETNHTDAVAITTEGSEKGRL